MNQFRRDSDSHPQPDESQDEPSSLSDDDLRWAGIASTAEPSAIEDVWGQGPTDVDSLADSVADSIHGSASSTADGVAIPFRSDDAEPRVAGTRRLLDDAMVAWLSSDSLPSASVLRDGLLLLNAGHDIDDGQRALLLRAALHHRRGVLTALGHQVDRERSALILHDALVDPAHPLPLVELERLLNEDPTVESWEPYLHTDLLETARAYDSSRSRLADAALLLLDTGGIVDAAASIEHPSAVSTSQALDEIVEELENHRSPIRQMLLLGLFMMLVLALMLAALLQYERSRTAGMIAVPGGEYALDSSDGMTRAAVISEVLLDAMETTNADYRRCVQRGKCPQPDALHSVSRPVYYNDAAFNHFPVIFVDHAAASAYCTWAGKRLPSADEWQVAASLAPATNRTYLFPWGDRYVAGLANDANAVHGDTIAVGDYRPGGDSPLGLSDMAGNVAEWTSTAGIKRPDAFGVKGGSFLDDADLLSANRFVEMSPTAATESIGIRCATRSLTSVILDWIQ